MRSKHAIYAVFTAVTAVSAVSAVASCLLCAGCGQHSVPRPRGYFRIDLPEHTYSDFHADPVFRAYPYSFEQSRQAAVSVHPEQGEHYWDDLCYPRLNARIHCSYKPVAGNLRELSDDAQRFVYNHAGKATSIPEQGYDNPEARVWGVYYELRGNTASPCQFYLTDSIGHFFRGALYFDCAPNQDSLAPVTAWLEEDVRHLIETFRWN